MSNDATTPAAPPAADGAAPKTRKPRSDKGKPKVKAKGKARYLKMMYRVGEVRPVKSGESGESEVLWDPKVYDLPGCTTKEDATLQISREPSREDGHIVPGKTYKVQLMAMLDEMDLESQVHVRAKVTHAR